jgi:uncharacterized protein YndB with AHSA1/START domain
MIDRQIVLPVSPAELWHSLTDPDEVATWFGGRIEWELAPGGPLEMAPHDDEAGARRSGVIEEVDPERALRFLWWPTDSPDERSEVSYAIEPHDDGSLLRVSERMAPFRMEASARIRVGSTLTAWDINLLQLEASSGRKQLACL